MSDSESVDLEREKNESYELGQVAQLETIADDLRERSGEQYARADSPRGVEKAKQLKSLAREYEDRAEKRREQWEEKYQ